MRRAEIRRATKETEITVVLDLDGSGKYDIDTGIGFFDHMLTAFARHGFFDLTVKVKGDLYVDTHHTVEDTGIVLGQAINEAVGGKEGICRYGSATVPMDESLVMSAVDLCGRAAYESDISFSREKIGEFETEMFDEFFKALSQNAAMNLHFVEFRGENCHHIAEAAFKAFARAMREAVRIDPAVSGVLSTKGSL